MPLLRRRSLDAARRLILRGRTRATVTLPGGEALPVGARLRSFEAMATLSPYAYLPLFGVNGSANGSAQGAVSGGAVLMTTLTVRSPLRSYEFLEGQVVCGTRTCDSCSSTVAPSDASIGSSSPRQVRASPAAVPRSPFAAVEAADEGAWLLSSGTEDYFLGSARGPPRDRRARTRARPHALLASTLRSTSRRIVLTSMRAWCSCAVVALSRMCRSLLLRQGPVCVVASRSFDL
jgi:hypothetical protein